MYYSAYICTTFPRVFLIGKMASNGKISQKRSWEMIVFCCLLVFKDIGYTLDNMPEWRNGRRTRLKIWHPFGYTGSTPVSGTIQFMMYDS